MSFLGESMEAVGSSAEQVARIEPLLRAGQAIMPMRILSQSSRVWISSTQAEVYEGEQPGFTKLEITTVLL